MVKRIRCCFGAPLTERRLLFRRCSEPPGPPQRRGKPSAVWHGRYKLRIAEGPNSSALIDDTFGEHTRSPELSRIRTCDSRRESY